jgi:hypothetical protein
MSRALVTAKAIAHRLWLVYHRCHCFTVCDETGCWGECRICGKRFGFVSRDLLRQIADTDFDAELRKGGIVTNE